MLIYSFKLLLPFALLIFVKAQVQPEAVVRIFPSGPDYLVYGDITIRQCEDGVLVTGTVEGLTPGFHGFHVHQHGNVGNGCKDAGGHFNPFRKNHGHPRSAERHVGDFGNIWADELGVARVNFFDGMASLDPLMSNYIGKRAIVVHAKADDLGRGRNEESLKTGNAGARVACGIIQLSSAHFSLPTTNAQTTKCKPKSARAIIVNGNSRIPVEGSLTLTQISEKELQIQGSITGLSQGEHGFHIHEKGDLGNACSNAGGHFNPFSRTHGDITDANRHVGDLGNIIADASGTASINIVDHQASLNHQSPAYVGGLAFVVHAKRDDLGRGGDQESSKTGNAGARVGCGLIEVEQDPSIPPDPPKTGSGSIIKEPGPPKPHSILRPIRFYNPATEHHNYNPSETDHEGALSASVHFVEGGNSGVSGFLKVYERGFGVFIEGTVSGLSPGRHGFHAHEFGQTGNNCKDAGGHFNPFKNDHGHPSSFTRHVGDFGNILADYLGNASIAIYDPHASLNPKSKAFLGNRAFVVHAGEDDLGRGGNAESLKTGNAGGRLACGIIKIDSHIPPSHGPPSNTKNYEDLRPGIADVEIIAGSTPGVSGFLIVKESDGDGIFIEGRISGLTPGHHGFHIHKFGKLTKQCKDAGGHFNPFEETHGSPISSVRHVGDLGNIVANENGIASIGIYDSHASLNPHLDNYIGGRSFVIHAGEDDLGQGGDAESLKTGNAGSRVGCGLIRIRSKGAHQTFTSPTKIHYLSSGTFYPQFRVPDGICEVTGATPSDLVSGSLELRARDYGTAITGFITGLSPGKHGFHIHQNADLRDACKNAGGHFNPFNANHGDPNSFVRHVGDLGNIVADKDGRAIIHIFDAHISLNPNKPEFIGGRAIVIHEKEDDLGLGNNAESLKTGNAGRRVACGVIKISQQILNESAQAQIQFPH